MFTVSRDNLKKAGFSPRSAPRSAPMRRPVLAGSVVKNILNYPNLWGQIGPSALEPRFESYKSAIGPPNQRTKYLSKVGINKLKISRNNLLKGMQKYDRNMTSVIMRFNKTDPKKREEAVALMKKEKRALKHRDLLPLSGAIKQAKSAMNGNFFTMYIPNERINFSPEEVNRLKRANLLNLEKNEIDKIVNAIRLKIPKK